jgi:hypothetical protein
LYLTKKLSKRVGAPVEARLLEPIYAFDREVVPAGSLVQGQVNRVQPLDKRHRILAILNGDFTPLRKAEVEFTTLVLPDGRKIPTHTLETTGLNSIYREPSTKKKPKHQPQPQDQNGGILGTAKQTAKDKINEAIQSRTQAISDVVRGPNKKEKLTDFMWAKLPYHPQYLRRGTRFDSPLRDSLSFGSEPVLPGALAVLGSQPAADSVVRVRLLTALDSGTAKIGEPVEAVTAAPLFSGDHKLLLPEGTRLAGTVAVAKRARSFHRAGQLRFNFQKVDLPSEVANLRQPPAESGSPESAAPARTSIKTQAILSGAESSGKTPIKVDSEGGVQAKESKTRFLAPVISLAIASSAANNEGRHRDADEPGGFAGHNTNNVSGRTLGGGLGMGLVGSAVSQSSKYVGMAFGYYGLAWSVYSNVVARGGEVQFDKDAMMDIKFGVRMPPQGTKFRGTAVAARQ